MREISILYIFQFRKIIGFFLENIFYQEYNLNLLKFQKKIVFGYSFKIEEYILFLIIGFFK